jgi:protein-disulfide isomerase
MASRAEQKAKAREERLAMQQAAEAAAARRRRLQLIGAVVVIAVAAIAVAVAISVSGGGTTTSADTQSPAAKAAAKRVDTLLAGIPQSPDNVLGNPSAPVTIIEYGDLECSVCDSFALPTNVNTSSGTPGTGIEDQVIQNLVRTGRAKFVYRALDTATSNGATPNMFTTQQVAVYAAGLQRKAWNYLELFYNEQGQEGTSYVTLSYLEGLAKQIPGLNYQRWLANLHNPTLVQQVQTENREGTQAAVAGGAQGASTPTVVVSGPKGTTPLAPGIPAYSDILHAVNTVA